MTASTNRTTPYSTTAGTFQKYMVGVSAKHIVFHHLSEVNSNH